MKGLFFTLALIACAALASGEDSAKPPKDLSGFSGYAWGASSAFIIGTMQEDGYEIYAHDNGALWYRAEVQGEKIYLVYQFDNDRLNAGQWLFDDADPESYWKVNDYLRSAYNTSARLKVRGEDIESELWPEGTDAYIVHVLDAEADRHAVYYYFQRGEE